MRLGADTGAVGCAAGGELDALGPFRGALGAAGEIAGSGPAGNGDGSGSHGREGEDGQDAGELHLDGDVVGLEL